MFMMMMMMMMMTLCLWYVCVSIYCLLLCL